ncbi:MAG: glycosyltransferase family 2 protein [bacterium]|nr:glycosyltransferase family 2 protein [bacterium]
MSNSVLVSIIIPCRNEEKHISKCLDSTIVNDYPKDKFEVLVVDGMSEDGTREIIGKYAQQYTNIKLLDNPKKIAPTAMNLGIKEAKGNIIIRMDAHTEYPKDYISKIAYWLEKSGADNVGGMWVTLPGADTLKANAIAFALSSPFGVGNAMFRIGIKEPAYVDTVPFGAYRKEVFSKIGLFDEELVRNQDDEFNLRLIKNGGKILLVPEIVSYYYARDSLSKLWRMYCQYGYFKVRVIQKIGAVLTLRQVIPSLFVGSLMLTGILSFLTKYFLGMFFVIFGLYLVANTAFSFHIALRKGWKLFLVLPLAYVTLHFGYGLGFLKGIWDFMILKKHLKQKIKDVSLTR